MSFFTFYSLAPQQKAALFEEVGKHYNLPDYTIEKDWWVTLALHIIFKMETGPYLLFKGGTSLSKGWGLIERFSEDIDLVINRKYLGFAPGLISKSQVRKLRSASYRFITGKFYLQLQEAFAAAGIGAIMFDFENLGDRDQDPVAILIRYTPVTVHADYLPPQIKVEIGSRSMTEPFTRRPVRSWVGEVFPEESFADKAFAIPCVNPERTLLEKLFLLHEEFQRPKDKIRVARLSRHLYDIWRIGASEYLPKAYERPLIEEIIAHRERFNNIKGVDYGQLFPPGLNPLPPAHLLEDWQKDYKTMRQNMIYGESPEFDDLLRLVEDLTRRYNELTK